MLRIGLVSDTHGLLRPEALDWLRGSDHILHAGDIGDAGILDALRALAPLSAVRGNNDHGDWAEALPEALTLTLGGVRVHLLHDRAELALDPAADKVQVLVCGHSHQPLVQQRGGVLYLNPGSAGPRRFKLPVSAGELCIDAGGACTARTVDLLAGPTMTTRSTPA